MHVFLLRDIKKLVKNIAKNQDLYITEFLVLLACIIKELRSAYYRVSCFIIYYTIIYV